MRRFLAVCLLVLPAWAQGDTLRDPREVHLANIADADGKNARQVTKNGAGDRGTIEAIARRGRFGSCPP